MLTELSSFFVKILWLQWLGATGALLTIIMTGMQVGMFSPYLSKLTSEDSPIPLTLNEASWTLSVVGIGRVLGAIFGSITVQYFGSKRTMLINSLLLMLSWICLLFANSAIWLHAMSFFRGIGTAISYVGFPIYLGEVASPARRGALVSYAMSGLPVGALLGTVLGSYAPRLHFACIGLVLDFLCVCIFMYVPESPHFLVRIDRLEEAKKSIVRYNPKLDVQDELESIQKFVAESSSITFADRLRELNTRQNIKSTIIILLLYLFMYFSGLGTIVYYMEIILKDGMVTVIQPATVVTVANVLDVISGWVSACKVDKYGRKIVWVISSAGASLSMIGLGLRFSLLANGYDSDVHQLLPILSIICYRIFLFVGICSVPSMYLSELLAPRVKTVVACFTNIFAGFLVFIAAKSYQPLVDSIGEANVCYTTGVFLMFAVIFGSTILPETTGKTLQAIQKM